MALPPLGTQRVIDAVVGQLAEIANKIWATPAEGAASVEIGQVFYAIAPAGSTSPIDGNRVVTGERRAYRKTGTSSWTDLGDVAAQIPQAERITGLSPYNADVYGSGGITGKTSNALKSTDGTDLYGLERYAFTAGSYGAGTGDGSVPGTTFASGHFSIKQGWTNSAREAQTCGINVVTRGGYDGPGTNVAKYGLPYNPSGDQTGVIVNGVQASYRSQGAVLEGVQFFAPGGNFASPDLKAINVQLAPMRQKDVNGDLANPGIGCAVTATIGDLGYAYTAGSTANGSWAGYLQFYRWDGDYVPFQVDKAGSIYMRSGGGGAAAVERRLVMNGPELEVRDGAGVVRNKFDQFGSFYIGTTKALSVPVTGFEDTTGTRSKSAWNSDTISHADLAQKVAAMWAAFKNQQLGAS